MKEFYRGFIKFIMDIVVFIEVTKFKVGEKYALFRKRGIYEDIKWSLNENEEFNNYWKDNYGAKITSNGHKLYEAINGIHHKEYIPDFIFATKIEPTLNPYYYAKIYSDKSLTEILYSSNKKVYLPKTYLVKSGGIFYDCQRKIISKERAFEILNNLSTAVIKPTVGGNSGRGVLICNFKDGSDEKNNLHISQLLKDNLDNFIVQEKMMQHEQISRIYPKSVNTFRVITYNMNGKVFCADLALRIGCGGSNLDNIHAGGIGIGVQNDGHLKKYAYKLGYSDSKLKLPQHPDTGLVFENYKVPGTVEIIECAIELHGLTPHIGIISWDFMVSSKENPVLIEANYWGQAVWFTQIVNGNPIFGDNTNEMLSNLKKK